MRVGVRAKNASVSGFACLPFYLRSRTGLRRLKCIQYSIGVWKCLSGLPPDPSLKLTTLDKPETAKGGGAKKRGGHRQKTVSDPPHLGMMAAGLAVTLVELILNNATSGAFGLTERGMHAAANCKTWKLPCLFPHHK